MPISKDSISKNNFKHLTISATRRLLMALALSLVINGSMRSLEGKLYLTHVVQSLQRT